MGRYIVTTYHHQFNPPKQITESEYNYYKLQIRANPDFKLNSKLEENPIIVFFSSLLTILLYAITYLFMPAQIKADIDSNMSKRNAKKEEDEFYETLKKIVIKSDTFPKFVVLVKNEYPFYV